MGYPVIVRSLADRYVAEPLGKPELQAEGVTEAEAIERVHKLLEHWLGSAKVVEVDVPTAADSNPWLQFFGRSADDPDYPDYVDEIGSIRAGDRTG